MENNNLPQSPQLEEQEESNDWQLYINKVWKSRKTIFIVTIIAMVIGLVWALTMKRIYTSEALLAPELNNGNRQGMGGLAGIASMLGGNLQLNANTTDAYNVTIYPKVIASSPFLVDLLNIPVSDPKNDIDTTLVGYLTREKGFSIMALPGMAISGIMSLFASDDDESNKKPNYNQMDPTQLTRKQDLVVKKLGKCIMSDVDKKTGETTISVTMDNPIIARTVADSICSKLCSYIINYRTSKAREDLLYYQKLADEAREKYEAASNAYASYQDHNRGLILNSVISEGARLQNNLSIAQQVYTQMAQQAEMARGKVQEEKPIFATIQPASVPVKASNSRAKVLLMFTFLGFAGSVVWVLFGKEYLGKAQDMVKAARTA